MALASGPARFTRTARQTARSRMTGDAGHTIGTGYAGLSLATFRATLTRLPWETGRTLWANRSGTPNWTRWTVEDFDD